MTEQPSAFFQQQPAPEQQPAPSQPAYTGPTLAAQAPVSYGSDDILEVPVKARDRKTVPFRLGSNPRVYNFHPPKFAVMMLPVMEGGGVAGNAQQMSALLEWLGAGLTAEENQHILDRLKDPEDDLDIDALDEIVQALVGKAGGRPSS